MSFVADPRELLAGYGRSVGLADVAFDDEGEALLLFDAIAVRFLHDEERKIILISSPLVNREVEPDIEVYARLLELNLVGILHNSGSIGLDRENRAVIFANSISLIGLDQARFNDFVNASVDIIDAWRKTLESGELKQAGKAPELDILPSDDGTVPTRV
ncbi:type III secretion system chaperone [Pseudochelatococcus sp. B33]